MANLFEAVKYIKLNLYYPTANKESTIGASNLLTYTGFTFRDIFITSPELLPLNRLLPTCQI
jgi:hypothetical protein